MVSMDNSITWYTAFELENKGFLHSQRLLLDQRTIQDKMQTTAVLLLILGVGYSFAAESCSVSPGDRYECGWYGIDQKTCEGRGCCYDDTDFGFETKWCFYPTGHKCYGIAPEEREDCGYFGIQREECENDRGCCFDHTVQNVAWCFKGSKPIEPGEATVPPTKPEEGTEAPAEPEEGTEAPAKPEGGTEAPAKPEGGTEAPAEPEEGTKAPAKPEEAEA